MMYGRIYLTFTDLTVCFFFVQFIQMKELRPHRIAGVALSSDLTNALKTNRLTRIFVQNIAPKFGCYRTSELRKAHR